MGADAGVFVFAVLSIAAVALALGSSLVGAYLFWCGMNRRSPVPDARPLIARFIKPTAEAKPPKDDPLPVERA